MKTETAKSCEGCLSAAFCIPRQLDLIDSNGSTLTKSTFCGPAGRVIRPDPSSPKLIVIRSGWAAKYLLFTDGRRQIVDILLPGDLATCEEVVSPGSSLPMFGLSDLEVCVFDRDCFMSAIEKRPEALLELWRTCSVQVQRLRRLLAAMGQQSAEARIADLIVSLHRRLKTLGKATDEDMPFHLRQIDLAEILGLTQVHVSRMLALLKAKKVIRIEESAITFLDLPALKLIAQA